LRCLPRRRAAAIPGRTMSYDAAVRGPLHHSRGSKMNCHEFRGIAGPRRSVAAPSGRSRSKQDQQSHRSSAPWRAPGAALNRLDQFNDEPPVTVGRHSADRNAPDAARMASKYPIAPFVVHPSHERTYTASGLRTSVSLCAGTLRPRCGDPRFCRLRPAILLRAPACRRTSTSARISERASSTRRHV